MEYQAPLYGFRAFKIEYGKLVSGAGSMWPFGVHEAKCESKRFHELERPDEPYEREDCPPELIPNPECDCGVYGYRDLKNLQEKLKDSEETYLIGAVKMWGKMCVHEVGSRSRYAKLELLSYEEMNPELERIKTYYRLELVPADKLEERVLSKGTFLPVLEEV